MGCVELIQGSVFELCLQLQVFDCCLLLDVLEHLVRPDLALQQVAKLLKDNDQIAVTVPNWTDWFTTRLLGLNPRHCTFHTPRGWKRLIEQCRFQVNLHQAMLLPLLQSRCISWALPYLSMCIVLMVDRG